MCIVEDYKSIELLIQGLLFLFHEPNIEEALSSYGSFTSIEELQEMVDLTKDGMVWYDITNEEVKDLIYIAFSNIYQGQKPKVSFCSNKIYTFRSTPDC